ncbi:MAG: hypothetical protein ACOCQG_05840 [Candidatus Nanoarchaeia archaeon]
MSKDSGYYEKSYSKVENSINNLKGLDKQLNSTDKRHHLKIIELLEEQLKEVDELTEYANIRKNQIVDRYKDLLQELEWRRKEADKKMKNFRKKTQSKLKDLKNYGGSKEEIDMLHKEMEKAENRHDEYIKKINLVEQKIKALRKDIENSSKKQAYSAKKLSRKH